MIVKILVIIIYIILCVCVCVCVCVCLCVCVCVCVCVILEHEDKIVRAELIWRVLIATIKTPIHFLRVSFLFKI